MRVQGDITNRNDKFHYELHREIYNMTSHLHYFVEICVLLEGEMEITVNGRSEVAKSGQCIFIQPFQEHSYHSEIENVFAIYAFSSSFIAEFMSRTEGTIGEKAVFDLSELTLDILKERLISERDFSFYNIKACLYLMLTDYTKQVKFVSGGVSSNVFDNLVYYLNNNYDKPCSLYETANALGYTASHISKTIHALFNINYNTLLNGIRIEHTKKLLTETNQTVLAIALECGFNDARSLQRNFKKLMGITPMEYREKAKTDIGVELTNHIFPKSYFENYPYQ